MNAPQRIVLVVGSIAVLALALYPPFFPRNRSARFEIELAAVTLATVGFVLALRGLPKYSPGGWLRRLSKNPLAPAGWWRLWIVLSLIYLLVVIGFAWKFYPREPSQESHRSAEIAALVAEVTADLRDKKPLSDAQQAVIYNKELRAHHVREKRLFVLKAVLLWAGPIVAVYLLAVAMRWVYRGFRPISERE